MKPTEQRARPESVGLLATLVVAVHPVVESPSASRPIPQTYMPIFRCVADELGYPISMCRELLHVIASDSPDRSACRQQLLAMAQG